MSVRNTAYVPWGRSPWTYKNKASKPENIKILGGKIDSITKDGKKVNLTPGESFGLANKQWVCLEPGESVTINYTAAGMLRRYRT